MTIVSGSYLDLLPTADLIMGEIGCSARIISGLGARAAITLGLGLVCLVFCTSRVFVAADSGLGVELMDCGSGVGWVRSITGGISACGNAGFITREESTSDLKSGGLGGGWCNYLSVPTTLVSAI